MDEVEEEAEKREGIVVTINTEEHLESRDVAQRF